jgi:PPOX class probable F420-dependent enzyme
MSNGVLPDAGTDFGRRIRQRLSTELVIWFSSVAADGTPQPNPVWFIWSEPDTVVVYNRPEAHRLRHVAGNPRVALHFDGDGRGGDVAVLIGRAELAPQLPAPRENAEYLAKYSESIKRVSGSPEAFSKSYSVPLTVHVARVRGF